MTSVLKRKVTSAARRLQAFISSQRFGAKPSEIYDDEFYEQQVEARQDESAGAVAEILIGIFRPSNVFDVGCGSGVYARELAARSISTFGCDGSRYAVRRVPPTVFCFEHDLKEPLRTNRRFDLCICFEVAEHIPTRFSENLVESCAGLSDSLVFSSAPPGQGGTDHINEQPEAFWHDLFSRHGMVHDAAMTKTLREQFRSREVVYWLTSNTRVYRRSNA